MRVYNYDKKSFYTSILNIAIPITLQHIAISFNSIIDNFMISKLGIYSLAALGSSNRFLQVFRLLIVGLGSANIILTSQYFAAKDKVGMRRSLSVSFLTNITISIFALFIYYMFRYNIINSFSCDLKIREISKSYLDTAIYTLLAKSIIFSYGYSLRSIGIVYIKTYLTLLSTFLNIVLNYLFIYSSYTRLGVRGIALSTLISESTAALIILYITYKRGYEIAVSPLEIIRTPKTFIAKYIKISLPLGISTLLWSSGLLFYHNILGSYGTDTLAAYGLINPFELLLSNIFNGLSNAAIILISKELGKRNFDIAYYKAKSIIRIGVLISFILSFFVFFESEYIISLYKNISNETASKAILFLKIYGIFLVPRVFNLISYNGILKSGGDSLFLLILGVCSMWLFGIPIVKAANIFKLESYKIYIIINCVELIISLISLLRVKSKKWIKNLVI